MSFSRPIQQYHSHADLIWLDDAFKTQIFSFLSLMLFQKQEKCHILYKFKKKVSCSCFFGKDSPSQCLYLQGYRSDGLELHEAKYDISGSGNFTRLPSSAQDEFTVQALFQPRQCVLQRECFFLENQDKSSPSVKLKWQLKHLVFLPLFSFVTSQNIILAYVRVCVPSQTVQYSTEVWLLSILGSFFCINCKELLSRYSIQGVPLQYSLCSDDTRVSVQGVCQLIPVVFPIPNRYSTDTSVLRLCNLFISLRLLSPAIARCGFVPNPLTIRRPPFEMDHTLTVGRQASTKFTAAYGMWVPSAPIHSTLDVSFSLTICQ